MAEREDGELSTTEMDYIPLIPSAGEERLADIGRGSLPMFETLGGAALLFTRTLSLILRGHLELAETVRQAYLIGNRSLGITLFTGLFTGMVFALQFMVALEQFGAAETVGSVVSIAIFRELGPVLTCLMVGGRVAAGITAELGSMQVSEQIDAIRALGADPIKKLVVPRFLAATAMMPLLSIIASLVGIVGAMGVAWVEHGLSMSYFYSSVLEANRIDDVMSGVIKTFFFGALIAISGCFQGFRTRGGTEGVGQSTTNTVVLITTAIFVADFVLTKAMIVIFADY